MNEEKPKFWKTPIGKIVSHGIHEHVNGSVFLSIKIKELAKDSNYVELAKEMEEFRIRCNKALDYIHENIKKELGYE